MDGRWERSSWILTPTVLKDIKLGRSTHNETFACMTRSESVDSTNRRSIPMYFGATPPRQGSFFYLHSTAQDHAAQQIADWAPLLHFYYYEDIWSCWHLPCLVRMANGLISKQHGELCGREDGLRVTRALEVLNANGHAFGISKQFRESLLADFQIIRMRWGVKRRRESSRS